MAATLEASEPIVETGALTKTQKLAALLVMLGSDSAAVILKQFQPREIEAISREMARFNLITREQQQEILMEFSEVAVSASTSVSAGVEATRNTLEKAFGSFKASDVLSRVTSTRALTQTGGITSVADLLNAIDKMRDIEAAQFRIIDAVRKLEAEGEIELGSTNSSEAEYEMV